MDHCLLFMVLFPRFCAGLVNYKTENSSLQELKRPKRIFGGDYLRNRPEAPFFILKYYVWYGRTWNCYEDVSWWRRIIPLYIPIPALHCPHEHKQNLICGGALISPKIVQTACHCLAYFETVPKDKVDWAKARFFPVLDTVNVYMGYIDVHAMEEPILSKNFVLHPMCGQFHVKGIKSYYRYDFAWVVLTDPAGSRLWDIDYAGPYKLQAIKDLYNKVTTQLLACLIVGFGLTDEQGTGRASRYLKYGWIQMIHWRTCYEITYSIKGYEQYYNYNASGTWVCDHRLRAPLGGTHRLGDSGGPVTCNNFYFAVISGFLSFDPPREGFRRINVENAVLFAAQAMAVEYRFDWEAEILDAPLWNEEVATRSLLNNPLFAAEIRSNRISIEPSMKKIPHGFKAPPRSSLALISKSSTFNSFHIMNLLLSIKCFFIL